VRCRTIMVLGTDTFVSLSCCLSPLSLLSAGRHTRSVHTTNVDPRDEHDYMLPHAIYTREGAESPKTDIHYQPKTFSDRSALTAITLIRKGFDLCDWIQAWSHDRPKVLDPHRLPRVHRSRPWLCCRDGSASPVSPSDAQGQWMDTHTA